MYAFICFDSLFIGPLSFTSFVETRLGSLTQKLLYLATIRVVLVFSGFNLHFSGGHATAAWQQLQRHDLLVTG